MQDWLASRVQSSPDAIALYTDSQKYSYETLNNDVSLYAGWLFEIGISKDDIVAVLMPNCYEYVCLIHALIRINALILPVNIRLNSQEIEYQLNHTDCKLIIASYPMKQVVETLTTNDRQIVFVENAHLEFEYRIAFGTIDLEAPCLVMFTSGTSGRPKGVVLTYNNLFYSAMASAYRIGVLPDDCWLCVLPLYHIGGLSIIIRSCLYGTSVDLHMKFDVDAVNHALVHFPITLVSLVPTMLYRLLAVRQQEWNAKLRLVLLGGAAASAGLMQACLDAKIPVAMTYGLSEAASQVATTLPGDAVRKPGSVGKALMFTSIRIVNRENKQNLPKNNIGEIVITGQTIMKEYYKDKIATQNTIQNNDLYTGDFGYLDDEDDLWVIQRRSDLIISGGENIYPAEIENILLQHPNVKSVAVVGIDHPEWGQQVAAAIVTNKNVTETEIISYCREHLATYKQPQKIKFVSELPQTASGKIHRPSVIELFQ